MPDYWLEPPEDKECPQCHGDDDTCDLCSGCGYVSRTEYREYIADAHADMERD